MTPPEPSMKSISSGQLRSHNSNLLGASARSGLRLTRNLAASGIVREATSPATPQGTPRSSPAKSQVSYALTFHPGFQKKRHSHLWKRPWILGKISQPFSGSTCRRHTSRMEAARCHLVTGLQSHQVSSIEKMACNPSGSHSRPSFAKTIWIKDFWQTFPRSQSLSHGGRT